MKEVDASGAGRASHIDGGALPRVQPQEEDDLRRKLWYQQKKRISEIKLKSNLYGLGASLGLLKQAQIRELRRRARISPGPNG